APLHRGGGKPVRKNTGRGVAPRRPTADRSRTVRRIRGQPHRDTRGGGPAKIGRPGRAAAGTRHLRERNPSAAKFLHSRRGAQDAPGNNSPAGTSTERRSGGCRALCGTQDG